MSTPNVPCAHLFTTAQHSKKMERTHSWMRVEFIVCNDCDDCDEKIVLRVYDDRRDDPMRNRPLTWGEDHHGVDGRGGQR